MFHYLGTLSLFEYLEEFAQESMYFFRSPLRAQIVKFSCGQKRYHFLGTVSLFGYLEEFAPDPNSDIFKKGCHYLEMCHYLGCHYYEQLQCSYSETSEFAFSSRDSNLRIKSKSIPIDFESHAVGVRYCLCCRYGRCAAILEFFSLFSYKKV